jgi:hypothetical protein
MRDATSLEINVTCMPSMSLYFNFQFFQNGYYDGIICKWETDLTEYYDTIASAETDCYNIGYSSGLYSVGAKSYLSAINKATLDNYIISSACNR